MVEKVEAGSVTSITTQAQRDAARELGREAGRAAGSWAADGDTNETTIVDVLSGLEAGDPVAYDCLPPTPSLSGEWAGDLTPLELAREVTGEDDPDPVVVDELAAEWEDGVEETFIPACEETLRAFLPGPAFTEVERGITVYGVTPDNRLRRRRYSDLTVSEESVALKRAQGEMPDVAWEVDNS